MDDEVQPEAPHLAQRAVREDGGILERDVALVIEAVGDPAADGIGRKPARVHGDVKRVLVVVTLIADGMKPRDEIGIGRRCGG